MVAIMIHHVNLIGMTNMIGNTKVNPLLNAVKFSIKKVIPILIILKNMNIKKKIYLKMYDTKWGA